ncbi:MAG: ATP-binding protein [Candidatus Margulisbacteria bacterium]|nr:ATP-binding protein [Candidatus Margulisiibacteriota bacterium]
MEFIYTLGDEVGYLINETKRNIPRLATLPRVSDKVHVVTGMRRVGKTHYLFQIIRDQWQKIESTQTLYINFEDDRLSPISQKELGGLLDLFYTTYPENHKKKCYLFFDEIQNIDAWEKVIYRFLKTKNVQIYITGSSSKLLSKEIATSLRGDGIETIIWPLSFEELHRNKKGRKILGKAMMDRYTKHLRNFLINGGFPQVQNLPKVERTQVLRDYVNIVVYRDIVERYKITNFSLINYLIKTLLNNFGCSFSPNKFYNDAKSQGMKVGKETVYDYLGFIEEAFLAFTVPLFSDSIRKTQSNPKKTYVIDTGLAHVFDQGTSQNFGRLFENLFYLDLRRKGHEVFYYMTETTEKRYEVDFVSKDIHGKHYLYQLCWNVGDHETLEREERALKIAEKELGIKGWIITPESYLKYPDGA